MKVWIVAGYDNSDKYVFFDVFATKDLAVEHFNKSVKECCECAGVAAPDYSEDEYAMFDEGDGLVYEIFIREETVQQSA